MAKVFELKKERAKVATEARKMVEIAVAENRDNNSDEQALITAAEERIAALDRQIAVLERVEKWEADGGQSEGRASDPARNPGDGPELDGKHKYSLLRAMRCLAGLEKGGLETEVSQHIESRTGKTPTGIFVPWNLATHRDSYSGTFGQAERRTALDTVAGSGTIANILGTDLIQLLRNKVVLARMGATVLNDMTGGTFSLPKQTAAGTAYYVAEGVTVTDSKPTVGQVTWTPKSLGARYPITRKFMLQSNQDAEALVREDLTRIIAIELDRAGINGSGQNTQPLGILQDPNIGNVAIGTNGGDPTWATVVGLETTVAAANADFGKLGYLTSAKGRGKLKQTAKIGSTFPIFMWENGTAEDEGIVNGYRAMATNNVPTGLTKGSNSTCTALIFGNFASATYAFWSGLDLIVDPYTSASSGGVNFVAIQDYDFQQRWEVAFAACYDMNQS